MQRGIVMKCITGVGIVAGGLGLAAAAGVAQTATITGDRAIGDTVTQLFSEIAEATNSLDLDRLLEYYENTEALTYVARGRVTRSHDAFGRMIREQFEGLSGADLRFHHTYVDVLSADVAVATATYEFTASFPNGGSAQSAGTYTCMYVRTDGGWKVRYSIHTFPRASG